MFKILTVFLISLFLFVLVTFIHRSTANTCQEKWCEKYSIEEIKNLYPGVFLTDEEHSEKQAVFSVYREKALAAEGVKDYNYIVNLEGDGDSCCATQHTFYKNQTMVNLEGKPRYLAQLPSDVPSRYQFVPHGSCIGEGLLCDGICVVEPITLTFLIYDMTQKSLMFDQFLVPGYCSCKRVLRQT